MSRAPDLQLRCSSFGDVHMLFKWRNHPLIVKNSSKKCSVTWEEHVDWLKRQLQDPNNHRIFIAESMSLPVGLARFDRITEELAVISAYLDPGYIGQGIGSNMIGIASRELLLTWPKVMKIRAEILKDNLSGINGFIKAGYLPGDGCTLKGHILYVYKRSSTESET